MLPDCGLEQEQNSRTRVKLYINQPASARLDRRGIGYGGTERSGGEKRIKCTRRERLRQADGQYLCGTK